MMQENILSNLSKANKEEIERLREKLFNLKQEKEAKEAEKMAVILEKNRSIENMSSQFSLMLKETLEKMKLRIEAANKAWEDDNESKMAN